MHGCQPDIRQCLQRSSLVAVAVWSSTQGISTCTRSFVDTSFATNPFQEKNRQGTSFRSAVRPPVCGSLRVREVRAIATCIGSLQLTHTNVRSLRCPAFFSRIDAHDLAGRWREFDETLNERRRDSRRIAPHQFCPRCTRQASNMHSCVPS